MIDDLSIRKTELLKVQLSEIKVQYRPPTDHFPVVSDENTILPPAMPYQLQIPERLWKVV